MEEDAITDRSINYRTSRPSAEKTERMQRSHSSNSENRTPSYLRPTQAFLNSIDKMVRPRFKDM